jgi:hypothetical protein
MTIEKRFPTRAEALAFVEGVEWVNDSAVKVLSVNQDGEEWVVLLEDQDAEEE